MNDLAVTVLAWIGAIWLASALITISVAAYSNRKAPHTEEER
ncbi:hypothetical protein ACFY74_11880 [Streptomyces massasporeus]